MSNVKVFDIVDCHIVKEYTLLMKKKRLYIEFRSELYTPGELVEVHTN